MRRRDLLKLGSAVLGGAALGCLTGCESNNNQQESQTALKEVQTNIIPKQTDIYNISSPMPFREDLINEIDRLNKKLKKSKVTTLYSSFPQPLAGNIHKIFVSVRGGNPVVRTLDDYCYLIRYATKRGFRCVYTLNSTAPLHMDDYDSADKKIVEVFTKLRKAGVNDVKIANPVFFKIFTKRFPDMNLHLSTTSEYHSVQIYDWLLKSYPNIKSVNISTDDNHNFEFLQSLRKLFPNLDIELLVNEAWCVKYCMSRYYHQAVDVTVFPCKKYIRENPYLHLTRNNLIHPWELEYYSAIGINNFKVTPAKFTRMDIRDIDYLKHYFTCADKGVNSYVANDIMTKIYDGLSKQLPIRFKNNCKLSELKKILPDMKYFVKNGSKCATECGTKCKYCYELAEKLKNADIYPA